MTRRIVWGTSSTKEKGEEERFFAERERKLLERLRLRGRVAAVRRDPVAQHAMPRCGIELIAVPHDGTAAAECPSGHGMWLDHADIEQLATRERDSWLGRFFHRPRRSGVFTGIIQTIGRLEERRSSGSGARLTIAHPGSYRVWSSGRASR